MKNPLNLLFKALLLNFVFWSGVQAAPLEILSLKNTKIIKPTAQIIKSNKATQIQYNIDKNYSNKFRSIQWEMKASKVGRPILSGNRYQLRNLVIDRGIKRQRRTLAANLGWYKKGSTHYNMKIQRKSGDGQVRYGDTVALHMNPYGWLKHKNQRYGINITDDDNNPHYIWVVKGGKVGQKLVSGMPFALFNTKERREVVYCKRTYGINLGWQGRSCKTWGGKAMAEISTKVLGEGGLLARDGLTGEAFVKVKDFLCDKGVKASAAYIAAQAGGATAPVVLAGVPEATRQCQKI